jgi:hypothetical protein
MSELLSVIDTLAVTDVHGLPGPGLLGATEELITARNRLDGVLAVHLQALDARDVTVSECGRHTRAWLIDEAHLSPEDAGRRLTVARLIPFKPGIGGAAGGGDHP